MDTFSHHRRRRERPVPTGGRGALARGYGRSQDRLGPADAAR